MSDWSAFLAERRLAVVTTAGADGLPHAVPVEVVVHDEKVYVWCRRRSVKAGNVARAAVAGLVAYKGHDFVLVRGPARLVDETDPSYERLATRFLEKYERDEAYGNDTFIEIAPTKISSRI